MARVENAVLPVSCVGSLRKVRKLVTKLSMSTVVFAVSDGELMKVLSRLGSTLPRRSDAALGSEKNAAVRAFCSDTSMPKTGASGARTMPSTTPRVSTTEIETSATLLSGSRICARVWLIVEKACVRIAFTSLAVSGLPTSAPSVPPWMG